MSFDYFLKKIQERKDRDPTGSFIETPDEQFTNKEVAEIFQGYQKLIEEKVEQNNPVLIPAPSTPYFVIGLLALQSKGIHCVLVRKEASNSEIQELRNKLSISQSLRFENTGIHIENYDIQPTSSNPAEKEGITLLSSGTTGTPKPIFRSWESILSNALSFSKAANYQSRDRILCTTPLHHSYALSTGIFSGLVSGATLLLCDDSSRPTLKVVSASKRNATVIQSVPFVYENIFKPFDTSGIRLFLSAGAPLSQRLQDHWAKLTLKSLSNHYGTTELGMLTLSQPGDSESVGYPLPGIQMRCHNEEIQVLENQSWVSTGDKGEILQDGRVLITGRVVPLINRGGNKIDPVEIERHLNALNGIQESLVQLSVPAESEPALLEALIKCDSEYALSETDIRTSIAKHLPPFKVPQRIRVVEELPRTHSGKIKRNTVAP